MAETTLVEFYIGKAEHPFASVKSQAVPRKGEFVSILKTPYKVSAVTWAVDNSNSASGDPASMRACVVVKEHAHG